MKQDYYVTLGVSKGADFEKIKHAYRKIVKQYHPDVCGKGESANKFRNIQEAYEVLRDRVKRSDYNRKMAEVHVPVHHREYPPVVQTWDRGFSLLDDFFNGLVWGFYDTSIDREKELYLELILTPEEASAGGAFTIHVPVVESCPQCGAAGTIGEYYCPVCGGYGKVKGERDFSLIVPPHIQSGTEVTVSLEGIGLKERYIDVLILVEEC